MATNVFYPRFPDIQIPEDLTVAKCIQQRAKLFGNKTALIDAADGRKYTYSDVIELVGRLAGGLHRRGVRKGDVILLCIANCIEYPIILLGATSIGAIVTTSSPMNTSNELYAQLKDSRAIFVISSYDAAGRMKEASDRWGKIKARFVLGNVEGFQPFADVMNETAAYQPVGNINAKDETIFILYTSGTTGNPKGVMLTHYNLLSYVYQLAHPDNALDFYPGKETYVCPLPFYHIYGICEILLYGMYEGDTLVVLPMFELESYLKAIQDFKVTTLHIAPPIAVLLSKHALVDKFDLSSVHTAFSSAAPLGKDLTTELRDRINLKNIRQGYGLTESTSGLLLGPAHSWRHGSAGMLLPNTFCRVIDVETGKDLDVGQDGELWFKGPQVMKGYIGRSGATAETVDKDGWLHTGDVGRVDEDGHYYVVARIEELIKYKGLQVAPAELEGLLLTHPSIADAAVLGVPDLEVGELPRAFCVKKAGAKVTESDVIKFIADQVSPHKRLRGGVEFIKEIPKSASGKILRRILREKIKTMAACPLLKAYIN